MEQGTNEWLQWRREGIGASDAPIIMGVSPWKTPYQLWEIKTGRVEEEVGNWATQRGNELEPKARAHLELRIGLDFTPILCQHSKYPFMRASLDGWNEEHKIILEIKCPGFEDHNLAANKTIPSKYYPQLQHQLFVTGASKVFYYSYFEDKEKQASGHLIEVLPDIKYQAQLFERILKFWRCVKDGVEPELTERDFKIVRDSDLFDLFKAWKETKDSISIFEKRLESLKEKIIDHPKVKGKRIKCGNFKVSTTYRKGTIDYKKIPELFGLDLEKYRSKSSFYQTISYKDPEEETKY